MPAASGLAWRLFGALALAAALAIGQAAQAQPRGAPASFADLVDELGPAVVNITTSAVVAASEEGPVVPEGSPFEDLFRDFFDRNRRGDRPRRSQSLGSGFIISEDGFIVTNNHVIERADEVRVELRSGEMLTASVVGVDPQTDIALLRVETDRPLPYVRFGDSSSVRVGEWVLAIGNPLGQGFSVSAGIVSARGRALRGTFDDYIQTDAAINRGNSGGPLFNMAGEVVGVNTAILSPTGGSIGIGFAMSSDVVSRVVDQLREFGETKRGWLGVRIQDVTDEMAEALGLETAKGAMVIDLPDGPASAAGVQVGDVIMRVDGSDVEDVRGLTRLVADSPVGATVRLVVYRDGGTLTIPVTLGRREEAEAAAAGRPAPSSEPPAEEVEKMGLRLAPLTDTLRRQFEIGREETGLVVLDVNETSRAFENGLRPGDLVVSVNQTRVETLSDFERLVLDAREAGRRSVLVLVRRGGEQSFVALGIEDVG
ncbi:MAG: Do family serine endopeptidase [Rhodobacteraceae bacterium]|nr:Do family serine endopeptidase [Paracoccaceae bacterium]